MADSKQINRINVMLVEKRRTNITPTGLAKGILDSTAPMRAYFLEEGVHDYTQQLQGQEFKSMLRTIILTEDSQCITQASFQIPICQGQMV